MTDGLSNSILLAESSGRPHLYRQGKLISGYPNVRVNGGGWSRPASDLLLRLASADGTTVPGPCAINCTNGLDTGTSSFPHPVYGTDGTSETYAFHTGGSNTLFGDGSVRFLSARTSVVVYAALFTRAGGEIVASD